MDLSNILVAIGGFAVGIMWGFNLHIAITKHKIRTGKTPKWLKDESNV